MRAAVPYLQGTVPGVAATWRRAMPVLAGLALLGCATAGPIPPGKIVSNNPCIDAILAEIADPATIGAVSLYSHDPEGGSAPLAWARRFPALGATAEEAIAARPRLVLTGNIASGGANVALARAGIRVLAFGVPATLAESEAQVVAIANAIGREASGKALVARMQAASRATHDGRTAIIWTSSGFVPGSGTIQDEMLGRAGFRNASALYGLRQWDLLPLETLLRNPPDLIFMPVSAKGDDARGLARRRAALRHLGSRARIIAFPESLLNCGGPSTIAAMRTFRNAGRT